MVVPHPLVVEPGSQVGRLLDVMRRWYVRGLLIYATR